MLIHLPTDYDFFCVTLAELSSCDRDCIVQKAKNIYYLHRISLLTLEQEDHTGVYGLVWKGACITFVHTPLARTQWHGPSCKESWEM